MLGQMELLDVAERAGRGGVTGEDNECAAFVEEPLDGFESEFVDHVSAAGAVGSAGAISEEEVVVLRERFEQRTQNREATEAGIEYTDHADETKRLASFRQGLGGR